MSFPFLKAQHPPLLSSHNYCSFTSMKRIPCPFFPTYTPFRINFLSSHHNHHLSVTLSFFYCRLTLHVVLTETDPSSDLCFTINLIPSLLIPPPPEFFFFEWHCVVNQISEVWWPCMAQRLGTPSAHIPTFLEIVVEMISFWCFLTFTVINLKMYFMGVIK